MLKNKRLYFKFQVTQVTKDANGDCTIEGYANTSTKDRVGDVVLPDAFAKSLPTYLKNPVMLLNHDWNDVVGKITSAEVVEKGLYVKGRVSDTRPDIKTLIKEGCYSTFSIGYNEVTADYDEESKTKYVKELELLEISIVAVPANTEASFTTISEKTEEDSTDVENSQSQADGKSSEPCSVKSTNEVKVKTASDLKDFIIMVKDLLGGNMDAETTVALCDYYNFEGNETMTKDELIKILKAKSEVPAATAPAEAAKTDDKPKEEKEDESAQPSMEDFLKQLMAKIDAMAAAMASLLEKEGEDKPAEEEKPEDKPADEEKPEDESKAMKCEKCGSEEMTQDEQSKKMKCAKCGYEQEAKSEENQDVAKELDPAEVDAEIAALDAEIQNLEETNNI